MSNEGELVVHVYGRDDYEAKIRVLEAEIRVLEAENEQLRQRAALADEMRRAAVRTHQEGDPRNSSMS